MQDRVDGPPPDDPLTTLRVQLQRLHRHNGEPSTREIARRCDKAISHTTVNLVLRCDKNPKWGPLELVVEALGGVIEDFRALWIAAREGTPATPRGQRSRPSSAAGGQLWPLVKAIGRLPSMTSVQDRNFILRVVEDQLEDWLEVDESPRAQLHIMSIVEACARHENGLHTLSTVLSEIDEGTIHLREAQLIIADMTRRSPWSDDDREALLELLHGKVFRDLSTVHRRVAGPDGPEFPAETSYRDLLLTIEKLGDGANGVPALMMFVEYLAYDCTPSFAVELREWSDRQADRLGIAAELNVLRAEIRDE